MKKCSSMCLVFILLAPLVFGQKSFSQGEELFLQNKPLEALRFLEAAVKEEPGHVTASLYLGMAYTQLNRLDDAINAYRKILPRGGKETPRIAFNLGNAYYVKGSADFARMYYTQAIEADPSYASAYLNRGNAFIKAGSMKDAVSDYELYLTLAPNSAKRTQVERVVTIIREELAAEERRRIAAEEAARLEEERKRKFLEEIAASLQAAAEDSRGLSAGSEKVEGYEGEFELE